jgi:hypothetical protein
MRELLVALPRIPELTPDVLQNPQRLPRVAVQPVAGRRHGPPPPVVPELTEDVARLTHMIGARSTPARSLQR